MKFTILTQYYPPETGAPQNRLHSLARNLRNLGHDVNVVTGMPNYPKMRIFDAYRGRILMRETIDGIDVRRSWLHVSRRATVVPRLANYFSFVLTCLFAGARLGRRDFLICESPPLFLGMSAVVLSRWLGARLIFNVSDLWPESAEKLNLVNSRTLLRIAYALEAWLYRRSYLITGQTQGIVRNILERFPTARTMWLPNGVDLDVYERLVPHSGWRQAVGLEGKKVFMYAGIVGHAQGLEVIVKATVALRGRSDIGFVIVGDGPRTTELQDLNQRLGAGVIFLAGVPKDQALAMVADAYACIVPLRKLDLFLGAIPSKVFDPLAAGVPILLGVDGEAMELFIQSADAGLHFEPENEQALARAVLKLADDPELRQRLGANGRTYVREQFDRRNIAASFVETLDLTRRSAGRFPV